MKWNLRLAAANRGIWKASELQRMLAEAGAEVTAASRGASPQDLPVGVRHQSADLAEPPSLVKALGGATSAFLLVPGAGAHLDAAAVVGPPDDLVAEDEWLLNEREIAFEDVEVGAADSAGEDTEEELAFGQDGEGNVFDLKGLIGGVEDGCFHTGPLCALGCLPIRFDALSLVGWLQRRFSGCRFERI